MPRGPSSCGLAVYLLGSPVLRSSPFSMAAPRSWNGWLVSPLGHTSDFINDRCCRPRASVPPSGLASSTLAEYLCDQDTWPKLTVI
ncbi:mCG147052 [Mus musculus]|nr:mCG147052 [Mus musculus]